MPAARRHSPEDVPQRIPGRCDDGDTVVRQVARGVDCDRPVSACASRDLDDLSLLELLTEGAAQRGGWKKDDRPSGLRRKTSQGSIDVPDQHDVALGQSKVIGQQGANEHLILLPVAFRLRQGLRHGH